MFRYSAAALLFADLLSFYVRLTDNAFNYYSCCYQ